MPSDKYLRYGLPIEPADPDAEFLTVQETAFVLNCSVDTVRRRIKELGIKPKAGRRKMLSRRNRLDINGTEDRPRGRRVRAEAA
ncbi:hypothetical protein ACIQVR_41845 [Streptomyces xanthochromogenes]|uniref:hypothetical protein n=1 Tax=Streptomyces xanthochromogenes TaxID=67384 RepID=UPI00381CA0C9